MQLPLNQKQIERLNFIISERDRINQLETLVLNIILEANGIDPNTIKSINLENGILVLEEK